MTHKSNSYPSLILFVFLVLNFTNFPYLPSESLMTSPNYLNPSESPLFAASDPTIQLLSNLALDNFCSGNGTTGLSLASAHVIENMQINAAGSGSAIFLENISRFLIVQNITLINSGNQDITYDAGFKLINCSNIIIDNCTIRNNGRDGILIRESASITIKHSKISDNSKIGISMYESNSTQILDSTITNNLREGVYYTVECHDHIIHNCNLSLNRNGAYIYKSSSNFTLTNNLVEDNDENGIYLQLAIENTINHNIVTGTSHSFGIYLELSSHNMIWNNTVRDVIDRGITLYETNHSMVRENDVQECDYGLELWGGDSGNSNTIEHNTFSNNSGYGIIFDDSCKHNRIFGNLISENGDIGLYLTDDIANTSVSQNIISQNGGYGILLDRDSYNNTFSYNLIEKSEDYAVHFEDTANSTFFHNKIEHGSGGLDFHNTHNSSFYGNTVYNHTFEGVYLSDCNSNLFAGNNITQNSDGFNLENCENNTLWLNLISNNTNLNGRDSSGDNLWDNGTIGNYWGDYITKYPVATSLDNIWQTEYEINGSGSDETFVNDTRPFVSAPFELNISQGNNLMYGYGQSGNLIEWHVESNLSVWYHYRIFAEEELLQSGIWSPSHPISLNVDGLEVGNYTYTLIVTDGTAWSLIESILWVDVNYLPDRPIFVTPSQTITNENITVEWQEAPYAESYQLYLEGTLLINTALTSVNLQFAENGTYSLYLIAINSYGFSPQSDNLTITVAISPEDEVDDDMDDDTNGETEIPPWIYITGGGVILIVVGGTIFFIIKRKK